MMGIPEELRQAVLIMRRLETRCTKLYWQRDFVRAQVAVDLLQVAKEQVDRLLAVLDKRLATICRI